MIKPITPINEAEAIIEPFWDPLISGIKKWTIRAAEPEFGKPNRDVQNHYDYDNFFRVDFNNDNRLSIWQSWATVNFSWSRYLGNRPVLDMERQFDLELDNYDTLLFSLASPENSTVILSAETDRGLVSVVEDNFPAIRKEVELDLQRAKRLFTVKIEILPSVNGPASGWFNWIGLRNSANLPGYLKRWRINEGHWKGYLKPESEPLQFTSHHGLYVSDLELERMQEQYENKDKAVKGLVETGEEFCDTEPEKLIGEYVNFWTDRRFNRQRDENRVLIGPGPQLALAGLIKKNKDMLRLAVRYALSLVTCGNWKDSFLCHFPGSSWEHKAFVSSLCMFDVSVILDMAGELLTPAGRNLILRKLAEETGFMNFNVFKYGQPEENIFEMNQMAWFSPGRIASLAVMEQYWTRAAEYTDIAYRDLVESLNKTILDDGAYAEGPSYFSVVAKSTGMALQMYAKARDKDLYGVIPAAVLKTEPFCDVFRSTVLENDMISIADSSPLLGEDVLSSMALLLPEGSWGETFLKMVKRKDGVPQTLNGWRALEKQAGLKYTSETGGKNRFLLLKEMGVFASVRREGDRELKIVIPGGRAGVGHNHDDKGSFVIEFAGDVFAADPGIGPYDEALAGEMKGCRYHNMLIPKGDGIKTAPENPLPVDIHPNVAEVPLGFTVEMDMTESWSDAYELWQRSWISETPNSLIIRDEYKLIKGDGVQFLWITPLPVKIEGQVIKIQGSHGECLITIPSDCTVTIEDLKMPKAVVFNRIVITRKGVKGTLIINIQF